MHLKVQLPYAFEDGGRGIRWGEAKSYTLLVVWGAFIDFVADAVGVLWPLEGMEWLRIIPVGGGGNGVAVSNGPDGDLLDIWCSWPLETKGAEWSTKL